MIIVCNINTLKLITTALRYTKANVTNPYHAVMTCKCKFLCNIVSSENLLCEICKEFAEKELRRYSYSDYA